jgi:ABC-type multidrug transport system fused ATPase/permease subunit
MRSKKSYEMSTQMIAAVQGMVLTAGFLGALFLGAYQVLHGEKSIGDAILLITYFGQLQGMIPLLGLEPRLKYSKSRTVGVF